MVETITITRKRYLNLLKQEGRLAALEGGGVDNWRGYSDCFEGFDKDEEAAVLRQIEADDRAEAEKAR